MRLDRQDRLDGNPRGVSLRGLKPEVASVGSEGVATGQEGPRLTFA